MSYIKLATSLRSARANVNLDTFAGGKMELYAGTIPTDLGAITTQTLLGEWTLSDPAGTETDGTVTFAALSPDAALASGNPTFVRLYDASDNALIDIGAGGEGSGEFAIVSPSPVILGVPINVFYVKLIEP